MKKEDNMSSIVDALDYISSKCNEIFITGGLGPTNDDITRFAVAEYLKLKCEFNQSSWDKIKNRFQDRNIILADTNRQQCMFPVGATIIENPISEILLKNKVSKGETIVVKLLKNKIAIDIRAKVVAKK